jgi:hypothetical protein
LDDASIRSRRESIEARDRQQQVASNSRLPAEQSSADKSQQEPINLNNKFRREKPDESDTKMIRINVIRKGFGPIFHGDQTQQQDTKENSI